MTFQDMIDVAQQESAAGSDPRFKPADWLRWAFDSQFEAFAYDGALRINANDTILPTPFTIDPDNNDPNAFDLPAQLLPYHIGLESYIKFRYSASFPKNSTEAADAANHYQTFLSSLGVLGASSSQG